MAGAAELAGYGLALSGHALVATGLALALWAQATLRASGAGVLVDHGPYAHSRNPMALGTAAFMLGLGLAVSATLLVLAAVVLLLILNRHHIPHEEAQLQRAYGGWYSDYAATVRRWL